MVAKTPLITLYSKACSLKSPGGVCDFVLHKISDRLPDWLFSFDRAFLLTLPQKASQELVGDAWTVGQASGFHFKKLALCRNMIDAEEGIALFKKRGKVCYKFGK